MPVSLPVSAGLPVDLDHLERMTLGEKDLEREVLQMFLKQTSRLLTALSDSPAEAGALSHTLKGSAEAVGAFRVAETAAAVESVSRQGSDPAQALAALHEAVAEAQAAIETLLRRF